MGEVAQEGGWEPSCSSTGDCVLLHSAVHGAPWAQTVRNQG
jgi:hypothetical protein